MAATGFNPLVDPATQAQIDRNRQFALLLQQQAMTPEQGQMVSGHYVAPSWTQGLSNVLKGYISKNLQEKSDQQQSALWQNQMKMAQALMGGEQPQVDSGTQALSGGSQAAPNDAENNNMGGVGPTVQNAQAQSQIQQMPQGQFPNQQGNNFGLGNLMKSSLISQFGGDPAAQAYWKQFEPTDATRMAVAAGQDPRTANADALKKATYIPPSQLRGFGYADASGIHPLPLNIPDGFMAAQDPNSPNGWRIVPIPGGTEAIKGSQKAQTLGKTEGTLNQGVDANGNPTYFLGLPPGIGEGGQSSMPPGSPSVPTRGMPTNNFNTPYPVTFGAPGSTATDQREGTNTNASVALHNPAIRPANPPGFNQYQDTTATAAGKRVNDLVSLAADSPTRVNVLDNILNLSKSGVATGPTQEWKNAVKGFAADSLGIKNWQNDVAGFQEVKKFFMQNGQRAWTAAGGTGTDAQLEAAMHANPNDKMFPQAVQAMANWAKAGELAVQGKANALQMANINNPQAQQQFEAVWRQNLDPRIYQMKLMDPQTATNFINILKKNPADYQALLQKAHTLKQLGGL